MATPLAARPFEQAIDPKDWVDFYVYFNQGAPDAQQAPFLLLGEGIASYSLSLTPEAVAVGLMIRNDNDGGADYRPKLAGNELTIWLKVADDMQADARFDANGVIVGIEATVVTTNNPPRRKQRTFLCKVVNL